MEERKLLEYKIGDWKHGFFLKIMNAQCKRTRIKQERREKERKRDGESAYGKVVMRVVFKGPQRRGPGFDDCQRGTFHSRILNPQNKQFVKR